MGLYLFEGIAYVGFFLRAPGSVLLCSSLNRMASILQSNAGRGANPRTSPLERTSLLAKAAERNGFGEDSFVLTLVITALQVPNLEEHLHHIMGSSRRQTD